MDQLPWYDYAGESADELFALTATHRLDSLCVAFETAIMQKAFKLGDSSLSAPERNVLAIEAMEREVNNGGYSQFFINSSNEYASSLVAALQHIGCPRTATISEQAIAALPDGVALSPSALEAEMARPDDDRDTRLDACDQAYYASGEDIAAALISYLQNHRGDVQF